MLHQCAPTYWAKAQHEGKSCLEQLFLVPSNAEGCREAQREGKCAKLLYRHPLLVPAIPAASRIASSPIRPPGKPPWKHLLHIGSAKTCSLSPFRGRHPADQSADRHREAEPHLPALLHNCSVMLDKLLAHRSFKGLFFFNGTSSYYWELYTLKKWCHSRHNFSTSQFFTWKTR